MTFAKYFELGQKISYLFPVIDFGHQDGFDRTDCFSAYS